MLPDAASLAVPIVLREKGTSGPLPCPATPAPSCRLAHQWLEGCWTPRLKVDLGACVALSPPPCPGSCSLSSSEPTNQPHRNRTKQRTTTAANLGGPPGDRDSRSALFPTFLSLVPRPRSTWRPCTLRNYESRGLVNFSPAHNDACSYGCNQKRLGQILWPKPGKQAHSKGLFSRSPSPPFPFPIPPQATLEFILYTVNRVTPLLRLFLPFSPPHPGCRWLPLPGPPVEPILRLFSTSSPRSLLSISPIPINPPGDSAQPATQNQTASLFRAVRCRRAEPS